MNPINLSLIPYRTNTNRSRITINRIKINKYSLLMPIYTNNITNFLSQYPSKTRFTRYIKIYTLVNRYSTRNFLRHTTRTFILPINNTKRFTFNFNRHLNQNKIIRHSTRIISKSINFKTSRRNSNTRRINIQNRKYLLRLLRNKLITILINKRTIRSTRSTTPYIINRLLQHSSRPRTKNYMRFNNNLRTRRNSRTRINRIRRHTNSTTITRQVMKLNIISRKRST